MSLRKYLTTIYKRKNFFDPTKNYSHIPQKLIIKYRNKKIINIGSGEEPLGDKVITLDRYTKSDIKANAISLPIKSNSFDLALSIAVLEHLKEPSQAIDEMCRILKPGGQVYIEIPFLQPFHSSPHDYFRATLPGLKHWCRQFKEIDSGVCVGSGSTVSWIMIEYTRLFFSQIPFIGLLVELGVRAISLPLKYLDKLIINQPNSHFSASAIYFHGQNPAKK